MSAVWGRPYSAAPHDGWRRKPMTVRCGGIRPGRAALCTMTKVALAGPIPPYRESPSRGGRSIPPKNPAEPGEGAAIEHAAEDQARPGHRTERIGRDVAEDRAGHQGDHDRCRKGAGAQDGEAEQDIADGD